MTNWFSLEQSELSPFSAPDHPSECGSHHDRDHHHVQKYPPMDDLQKSPPAPATRQINSKNRKQEADVWCFSVDHVCVQIKPVYLVVVEGIYECYEPPGLSFLVQRQ